MGESHKPSNLVFSVKRSSVILVKTKLHVFFANNTRKEVCDYKIKGCWNDRSCKSYAGDTYRGCEGDFIFPFCLFVCLFVCFCFYPTLIGLMYI